MVPLRLEEATEGTGEFLNAWKLVTAYIATIIGAICGSAILDEKFEDLLKEIFGYRNYMRIPEATRHHAMQYWQEQVKPNYNGDTCCSIPFPGKAARRDIGLTGGFLELAKYSI